MVQSQYIKGIDFNLSSVNQLKTKDELFSRTGYTFVRWEDINKNPYADAALVNFTQDTVDLSAIWEKNKYTVSWDIPTNGAIEVKLNNIAIENGSKVEYESNLVITAIAQVGYKLHSLVVNGEDFTSGSTFVVNDSNVTIAATFDENTGIIKYWPNY